MLQVRLLELFAGFEGLVEDRARKQVAHLQADQSLAAAGRGRGNFGLQAVIRRAFKLKNHLALYFDCFNQCGHAFPEKVIGRRARGALRRPLSSISRLKAR